MITRTFSGNWNDQRGPVSGFSLHSDNFDGLRFNLFEGRYVNDAIKFKIGGPVYNETERADIEFA